MPAARLDRSTNPPRLLIGGKIASPAMARPVAPGALALEKLEFEYADSGIDVMMIDPEIMYPLGWDGDGGYDHRRYEHHLERVLDVRPDLKMILFVGAGQGVPYRWARKHSDQLALLDNGDPIKMPSMVSPQWRTDFDEALRRFVLHFEAGPFADYIIGYNPIRNANEWFGYDLSKQIRPETGLGKFADFSQPMVAHYRAWLAEWYGNDEAALQEAWRRNDVTFDTAEVPTPSQRIRSNHDGTFITDGPGGSHVHDWYRCYNQANTRDAIATCRALKRATKEAGVERIVGLMHGYSEVHDQHIPQEFGHIWGHEIVSSKTNEWIDFLHSPHSYHNRQATNGVHQSKYPVSALPAAGKLHIDQFDFQTHHFPNSGHNKGTVTREEAIGKMKRGLGFTLQHGSSYYWHEGGPGRYDQASSFGPSEWCRLHFDDPAYREAIKQIKKVSDVSLDSAAESAAEVAVIHAPTAYAHLNPYHSASVFSFFTNACRSYALPKAGVPYDEFFLENWAEIKRPYKVYLFLAPWDVTVEQRAAIHAKLAAEQATAIWCHAAGRYAAGRLNPDGPRQLTGFRLQQLAGRHHAEVDISPDQSWLAGLDAPTSFGTHHDHEELDQGCGWWPWPEDHRLADVFHAQPTTDATVLGRLRDLDAPGLVVKPHEGFTSIHSAAPLTSPAVLASLFQHAGVHRYTHDGDGVNASTHHLTLHAAATGDRRLRLREPADVFDAFNGEPVHAAGSGDTLTLTMQAGETRVLVQRR